MIYRGNSRRFKPHSILPKKGNFKIFNGFRGLDLVILVLALLLTFFGLLMVYDASAVHALRDFNDKYYYVKQQSIWIFLGLSSLIFFSFIDYRIFNYFAKYIFIAGVILILAVMVPGLGVEAGGAHRWLRVAGFTIQPSEIIKLASVIFFASLFSKGENIKTFLLSSLGVIFILGVLQKDLGSAIVFFLIAFVMYYISGAKTSYILGSMPLVLIGFLGFVLSSEYRKQRVLAFLDPFADPQGYTYHISQVLIALGTGGFFGLGLGQSRQKFEYIPEVTTDSIFAIVGEEFGFLGGVILIAILMTLVYRGLKIAEGCSDHYGKLLGFGLSSWIGIQAVVNLAAMVSLVPLTGVPLPFISYGGSALLANLTAIGIILNISKNTK